MKLICPRCSAAISSANVNLAEAACRCGGCGDWFQMAALLRDSTPAERTSKPPYTNVEYFEEEDSIGLIVPGRKWLPVVWLVLGAVVWCGITCSVLLSGYRDLSSILALVVYSFLVGAIVVSLVAAYVHSSGEFNLLLDRSTCSVGWSVGNWVFRKTYPTVDINAIVEVAVKYAEDYKPLYGVGIKFFRKTIKFGGDLSEAERLWIVGELRHYLELESLR